MYAGRIDLEAHDAPVVGKPKIDARELETKPPRHGHTRRRDLVRQLQRGHRRPA